MRPITYQIKSINTKHKLNAYKRYLSKHISLLGTSCLFTQDTNKIYPLNNQIVVTDIFCGLVCYFLLLCILFIVYGCVMDLFVVRARPLQTYSTNNYRKPPKQTSHILHMFKYIFSPTFTCVHPPNPTTHIHSVANLRQFDYVYTCQDDLSKCRKGNIIVKILTSRKYNLSKLHFSASFQFVC